MNIHEKCRIFLREMQDGPAQEKGMGTEELRSALFSAFNELFNERINGGAQDKVLQYIAADSAVVEIEDTETGLFFRRELPLRYEETGNGVSLIGEDISGRASQISFLSQAAYDRIADLTGKGPDAPKCGGHT